MEVFHLGLIFLATVCCYRDDYNHPPHLLFNEYWDDFKWTENDFIDEEIDEKFEHDWKRAYIEYTSIDANTPPALKSERTMRYRILEAVRYNSEYDFRSRYNKHFMTEERVFYHEEDKVIHNPLKDVAAYYDKLIDANDGKNIKTKDPNIYDFSKYPNLLEDEGVDQSPLHNDPIVFEQGEDYGLSNVDVQVIGGY